MTEGWQVEKLRALFSDCHSERITLVRISAITGHSVDDAKKRLLDRGVRIATVKFYVQKQESRVDAVHWRDAYRLLFELIPLRTILSALDGLEESRFPSSWRPRRVSMLLPEFALRAVEDLPVRRGVSRGLDDRFLELVRVSTFGDIDGEVAAAWSFPEDSADTDLRSMIFPQA